MIEELTLPTLFDTEIPAKQAPKELGSLTCFGPEADALARERGGWPSEAVVYLIEAINKEQAMLTGEVPIGARKKDPQRPQFSPRKSNPTVYRVVIPIADWHALWSPTSSQDQGEKK